MTFFFIHCKLCAIFLSCCFGSLPEPVKIQGEESRRGRAPQWASLTALSVAFLPLPDKPSGCLRGFVRNNPVGTDWLRITPLKQGSWQTRQCLDLGNCKIKLSFCPDGETGRRSGLKIRRPQGCGGSSPPPGTNKNQQFIKFNSYKNLSIVPKLCPN